MILKKWILLGVLVCVTLGILTACVSPDPPVDGETTSDPNQEETTYSDVTKDPGGDDTQAPDGDGTQAPDGDDTQVPDGDNTTDPYEEDTQEPPEAVVEADGITYTLTSEKTYAVTAYTGSAASVTIPATVNQIPVTAIHDKAFYGCKTITSVSMEGGVTEIGTWAFGWCPKLKTVTLPNTLQVIGVTAFEGCAALTEMDIPDSVTTISEQAFRESGLTRVTLGNQVKTIGDKAFYFCAKLQKVTVPDSVEVVGESAFARCAQLKNVTLGKGVADIGLQAFSWCPSLQIEVADGNKTYQSVGNCLIRISDKTLIAGFSTSVIPTGGSVETIGEKAFYGCSVMTTVSIPKSVTRIEKDAFAFCGKLARVEYAGTKQEWNQITVATGNQLLLDAYA